MAREAEEGRRQVARDWAKPLETRVAEGISVAGAQCRVVDRSHGLVEAVCPGQRSRIRPGDLVRVGFGAPPDDRAVTAFVEEADPDAFLLFVGERERGVHEAELEALPGERVLDPGHMDLSSEQLGALQRVAETAHGRERILPLLMGRLEPVLDAVRHARGLEIAEAAGLNWSQCEAFANAYACERAALVQGPPGTGKTRVLAELAGQVAREGGRVLVTSLTHRAIHNALGAVARRWRGTVAVGKIGGPNDPTLAVPVWGAWKDWPGRRFDDGCVMGATPFAAAGKRLDGAEFDLVLVDEASQMTLPLACMAMLKGSRFAFFGDHRQLPPVLLTVPGTEAHRASVFGSLAGRGFDAMLTETYRLPRPLADWSNRHFYGGALEALGGRDGRILTFRRPPERFAAILDPAVPRVFCEVEHREARLRSDPEAEAVASLVAEFLRCGVPAGEIAVIAPFRAQGAAVREALETQMPDRGAREGLVVDTVERMQGQERDVVLVSLTTSDPGWVARLAEFYFQPERLNVSVTRARHKLVLVGSSRVLEAFPKEARLRDCVELLRTLLAESRHVRWEVA